MPRAPLCNDGRAFDTESQGWIEALSGIGAEREAALARLHALLLRASHFEIARRRRALSGGHANDRDDLAVQTADDALMAIMAKLHTFRGDSRFTTWAYKFALLEAGVKLRRRAWQGREIRSRQTAGHSCPTAARHRAPMRRPPSSSARWAMRSPRC
jgi:DNA-directed RNA polymerase specialized sigma24 family protein